MIQERNNLTSRKYTSQDNLIITVQSIQQNQYQVAMDNEKNQTKEEK